MTWVTWRQSRMELLIGGIALSLVAAFLLWTGLDLRSDYKSLGIASCLAESDRSQLCSETLTEFSDRLDGVRNLAMWLSFLPLLIGALLAAPVILDLEHGTYRLAWTQGVTRRHWLGIKIVLALAVMTLGSVLLMVLWRWWDEPFDTNFSRNQFDTSLFDNQGIVLVAYTVFAFALCLAVGTVFRRSVPAFGIALVGFVAIRIGIEEKLRPNFLEPRKFIGDPMNPPELQIGNGAWILEYGPSDQFGHMLSWSDPAVRECFEMNFSMGPAPELTEGPVPEPTDVDAAIATQQRCFEDHDIYMTTLFHPADRYWIFQGIESAIFLGMAAILLGITFYWVTRRIAR
jgi:hypothetical protein